MRGWSGRAALLAAFLLAGGGIPGSAAAQEPPARPGAAPEARLWTGEVRLTFENVAARRDWELVEVMFERRLPAGALQLRGRFTERFGRTDEALLGDLYIESWPGGYLHAHAQAAPGAEVLPRTVVGLELFHGLPGGWEPSVSYRRMNFEGVGVDLVSGSVAKYLPGWYLRGRGLFVRRDRGEGVTGMAQVRRYLGGPESFVELRAGLGRNVVTVGAGPRVVVRETGFASARWRQALDPRAGVDVTLRYNDEGGSLLRRAVSAGVFLRW